jgi:type II secretory pathway pseudopilin PulG
VCRLPGFPMNQIRTVAHIAGRRRRAGGFTLAEALIAITLCAMASSSLLLAAFTSMRHATDTVDRMFALAICEQMLDEITGFPYKQKGVSAYQTPIGPGPGETVGPGGDRTKFNDLDDFAGYTTSGPIADRWGKHLLQGDGAGGLRNPGFRASSTFFQAWTASVTVFYVSATDLTTRLPPGQTSGFREVEIVVTKTEDGVQRELARCRRVVAYVQSS